MIDIENIMPISKVEHNCILSMQGDITIAYEAILPEIFTLSDRQVKSTAVVFCPGQASVSLTNVLA